MLNKLLAMDPAARGRGLVSLSAGNHAAVAALLSGAVRPKPASVAVCVVSGGNVDPALLKRI